MDLLFVLEYEIGHLLCQEHKADGLMAETLAAGTRLAASSGGDADTSRFAAAAVFPLAAADEGAAWIGSSLFGRGRQKR